MICPSSPCHPSDVSVKLQQNVYCRRADMKEHLDRILALKNQEDTKYHYEIYASRFILYCEEKLLAPPQMTHAFDNELRGRICAWNFRVVDHCNFPRELAERSLSFFDRCMATRGNRCPTEESSWYAVGIGFTSVLVLISKPLLTFSRRLYLPNILFWQARRYGSSLFGHQDSPYDPHWD